MKAPKNVSSKNMKSPKKLMKSQKNDISKKKNKVSQKTENQKFSELKQYQCQTMSAFS